MKKVKSIFWNYHSDVFKGIGVLPPERIGLKFSSFNKTSTFFIKDFAEKNRAIEHGYQINPNDCPAVVGINNYGFMFRCPQKVNVSFVNPYFQEKLFDGNTTKHGHLKIVGDYWPRSDSDKVVSWISGSKFFKFQTGLDIYFPSCFSIYQGPIPFGEEYSKQRFEIWQGIEIFTKKKTVLIDGEDYAVCNVNFIGTFKAGSTEFDVNIGDPIGVLYPVLNIREIDIKPYENV